MGRRPREGEGGGRRPEACQSRRPPRIGPGPATTTAAQKPPRQWTSPPPPRPRPLPKEAPRSLLGQRFPATAQSGEGCLSKGEYRVQASSGRSATLRGLSSMGLRRCPMGLVDPRPDLQRFFGRSQDSNPFSRFRGPSASGRSRGSRRRSWSCARGGPSLRSGDPGCRAARPAPSRRWPSAPSIRAGG